MDAQRKFLTLEQSVEILRYHQYLLFPEKEVEVENKRKIVGSDPVIKGSGKNRKRKNGNKENDVIQDDKRNKKRKTDKPKQKCP